MIDACQAMPRTIYKNNLVSRLLSMLAWRTYIMCAWLYVIYGNDT